MKPNLPLQKPNIHIDKIRMRVHCVHTPLGKSMFIDQDDLGILPCSSTPMQISLIDGWDTMYVRSMQVCQATGMAEILEIHCCPPLVLQRHNLFGHANLQSYINVILEQLTQRLGIDVDPFDRKEWERGAVTLTEIHLTANFACPTDNVLPIIQAIDNNLTKGKQRTIESCITLNNGVQRRSTTDALTIYDKSLELQDRFKTPGEFQAKLIDEAKKGIRAEVKLYSQGLKSLKLDYGMRWENVDIEDIYFKKISKFNIPSAIQILETNDKLALLSRAEAKTYQLWLSGCDIREQLGRTTAWKQARSILSKTGIDIRCQSRPTVSANIDLAKIFSPENILPIPEWALDTIYYFPPNQLNFRRPLRTFSNLVVQAEDTE